MNITELQILLHLFMKAMLQKKISGLLTHLYSASFGVRQLRTCILTWLIGIRRDILWYCSRHWEPVFSRDCLARGGRVGFCALGIKFQPLDNLMLREFFNLGKLTGILVTKVAKLFKTNIQLEDVILSFDGYPVGNNGDGGDGKYFFLLFILFFFIFIFCLIFLVFICSLCHRRICDKLGLIYIS